jgi:hypothetical protein
MNLRIDSSESAILILKEDKEVLVSYDKGRGSSCLLIQGYGCAQAVFTVFAPDFGVDRDTTLRISQGFSAGMSCTDNICGPSLVRPW